MSNSVLAAQLYSVREYTKTPADIAKTLARLRKMGYTSVQLSALGRIDPHELAKLLKENGLTCCATHASVDTLRKEPQRVIVLDAARSPLEVQQQALERLDALLPASR